MSTAPLLRALALHARTSHEAALIIVGWWCAGAGEHELSACLDYIHEVERQQHAGRRPQAAQERFPVEPYDPRD